MSVDIVIEEVKKCLANGEKMADLARYLQKPWSQCSEWVKERKYEPSGEVILKMVEWVAIKSPERKLKKELTELEKFLIAENNALKKLLKKN